LLLKSLGADPGPVDQIAGEHHELYIVPQDFFNEFAQDEFVDAGDGTAAAVAGHDESPAVFAGRNRDAYDGKRKDES